MINIVVIYTAPKIPWKVNSMGTSIPTFIQHKSRNKIEVCPVLLYKKKVKSFVSENNTPIEQEQRRVVKFFIYKIKNYIIIQL